MEGLIKRSKIFSAMFCGWMVLSAAFGIFLILTKAHFEITGTKKIFGLSTFLYVIIAVFLGLLEYGFIKPFGIKRKGARFQILRNVLVDTLTKGRAISSISTKDLTEAFYSLIETPRKSLRDGVKYIVLVIFSSLLTEWLVSGKTINLPVILCGGLISLFLVLLFGQSFVELAVSPAIIICRKELKERGIKFEEPRPILGSLKTKFSLFFSAPILIFLIILSFITTISLNIIIFSFFGLAMSIIISWTLYSRIIETFSAIEIFSRELPKEKKTSFLTGSLDVEIFDLYKSLNKAAEEVYTARRELQEAKSVLEIKVKARTSELEELTQNLEEKVKQRTKELEKSKGELEKRVDELERFHKLTVGRELKMIELKKEIEKLEEENKRFKEKLEQGKE